MRRRAQLLFVALLGCAIPFALGGAASAAPVKKCVKGKVALVVNGKRTCVLATRFRQRATPPPSLSGSLVQQVMKGGAIPLRLKNGQRARPPLPKAVVNSVARQYLAGEAQLVASLQTALATPSKARR